MNKLLRIISFIKLPDDFTGDELDAMQFYIDYRRKKERPKTFHDLPEEKDENNTTMKNYMDFLYDRLKSTGNVRGGQIALYEHKGGEWTEKETITK